MTRRDLIFRVFVSSTFSDMKAERNALQEEAFDELRKYCEKRGARFQAIDLRWGVSQEAALDQQTMNICLRELKRCQVLSPRPNFIVLLGSRYGWRPLPPQIDAKEFEEIKSRMSDGHRVLLVGDEAVPGWEDGRHVDRKGWYRKDLNAVPAEYVLQPRTIEFSEGVSDEDRGRIIEEEDRDWRRIEGRMREMLLIAIGELGWLPNDPRRFKYEASATHQEIRAGALDAEDPASHVFCYFREIDGLPEDVGAKDYRDIDDNGAVDTDAQERLRRLKRDELGGLLPEEHIYSYRGRWGDDHVDADLDALSERVKQDLQRIIDLELGAFEQGSQLARERESHGEFAHDRSSHFMGREDVLARVRQYVASDETCPLIIHGGPGSGKSALLAKSALDLEGADSRAVVLRFVGVTPTASELRSLLVSLCEDLGELYGQTEEIPNDINELVRDFHKRLGWATREQPLVVFIDAVEQLDPGEGLRALFWVPRDLPPHVKFVASVMEAEGPAGNCFETAKRIFPEEALVGLNPLSREHAEQLLNVWLNEAARTLQPGQRDEVLDKFDECPWPLYLKLAFEEARLWPSWQPAPDLHPSIEGILEQMLNRLEHPEAHGRGLVSRSLGYLACGRHGLTEDEMLAALSRDRDVMRDFRERSPRSPDVGSLPVVVWSRLYGDLERDMARRRADGTVVLSFYHAQVREAVERRYLSDEEKLARHRHLADYFESLDYWLETLEEQRARVRRLPPTPRPANVRKVVELPHQRIEAAKLDPDDWDKVADLLMDWEFLEAKTEADPDFRFEREAAEPSASASGDDE